MAVTDTLERPRSVPRDEERRAEEERIERHWTSFWEQMAIIDEVLDEWRAQGILPPEGPRGLV